MSLIDHLSVGVSDITEATRFYDATLAALGSTRMATSDAFAAYGQGTIQFLAMKPNDGEAAGAGNGTHICFAAPSQEAFDAFHAAALSAGGQDEGKPGPREAYPIPDVYAAFVRDPFGNKLEAIHNGFAG